MKIFLTIVLFFILKQIGNNLAVPSIKPSSERDIIFPNDDQYDECFIDESKQIRGTCKKLLECVNALERWLKQKIRPQTCFFNKNHQGFCCENETSENQKKSSLYRIPVIKTQRRSESACELYNGAKTSVVNGKPTKPREFPFMAALGWKANIDNHTTYNCGGALISSKFVLTAAHCMDMGGEPPSVVRLGGVNLTDSSVEDVPIKRIIVHPDYNVSSSYNDIALIELAMKVRNDPACIWSEHETEHNNVTAIGYGHTRFAGFPSNQLLKANLSLITNNICEQYYKPDADLLSLGVASTHICARDPEKLRDTCQGDSGGPIISKIERFYVKARYVIGITSFGQGCAGGPPGIYTRISSYTNWIEDIVWPDSDIRTNL